MTAAPKFVSRNEGVSLPLGLAPEGMIDPSPFVRRSTDGANALFLNVKGAHCGGCISRIENGLSSIPDVETARLNLSTGRLSVKWRGDKLHPKAIVEKITTLGFEASAFDPEAAAQEKDNESRFLLRCLAVAGFAAANIMLLSVSVWAGHDEMGAGDPRHAPLGFSADRYSCRTLCRSAVFPLRFSRLEERPRQYGRTDFPRGLSRAGLERL